MAVREVEETIFVDAEVDVVVSTATGEAVAIDAAAEIAAMVDAADVLIAETTIVDPGRNRLRPG